jgi:galactosylgalactosylxylosylprotein 3-beta-glucuronosyltransferase 3
VYEAYQREKALEKCNFNEQEIKEFLNWTEKKRSIESLPVIYMITPTYSRWTQKADLTRLCNTLTHVPHLVWMVVEDSEGKTSLVTNLLRSCAVTSVHLNVRTEKNLQLGQQDPRWKKHRGVDQRNTAIKYLREHQYKNGVVYFGDDDNTYSIKLFEEMRGTKKVSVWPVGLSGELKFEGPVCEDGWVVGWHTSWEPSRPFPIDMAGVCVCVCVCQIHRLSMYAMCILIC